jgi:hypothetical protein
MVHPRKSDGDVLGVAFGAKVPGDAGFVHRCHWVDL